MLGPPFLLIIFVSVLLCKRGATEKLGGMELRGVFYLFCVWTDPPNFSWNPFSLRVTPYLRATRGTFFLS